MEVLNYPETAFEKLPATMVPAVPTKTPASPLHGQPARFKNGMAAGPVLGQAAQTRLFELVLGGSSSRVRGGAGSALGAGMSLQLAHPLPPGYL